MGTGTGVGKQILAGCRETAVRLSECAAAPSALIGASNVYELAAATAISLFELAPAPGWPL
ncbi:hypothetical protein H1Q64_33275 (plasmid) [Azospirillum brasilense]|nr:hypothetical protein H1Q64_33275 [Azospirillum brasilense]